MELFIFDMDGVLIRGQAYHRALQETVNLVGNHLGLENINLTFIQIAQFQALGISSEWHSSALCQAKIQLDLITGNPPALRQILLDKNSIILRDSSSPHMGFYHHETCVVYHNYKSFPKLQALNSDVVNRQDMRLLRYENMSKVPRIDKISQSRDQ